MRWVVAALLVAAGAGGGEPQPAEMAGYLLVPHERVDASFDAGFSMYVAAWPLLENYPGNKFQTGLFGTWMFAAHDPPIPHRELYSDIEGGLGWWRDTRFATETPKFIMGGVALGFSEWANGPGAGKGRDWAKPRGKYAVAQLSNRLMWPPDGVNLMQGAGAEGPELFGYGYLPLPLAESKERSTGEDGTVIDVPTGDQCWTLFLNTGNFKGPVTFFVPYFWSKPSAERPELAGKFLDSRPSNPNKAVQMETQYVPAYQAEADGVRYARVAPVRFPRDDEGRSPVVHRITAYRRAALWDGVKAWLDGGEKVTGKIDADASVIQTFPGGGGSTWRIYEPGTPRDEKRPLTWNAFARPTAIDAQTFGYQWDTRLVSNSDGLVSLPEYYRFEEAADPTKTRWVPVVAADVPAATGLADVEFPRRKNRSPDPYVTPEEADSSWKRPGPVAGPFTVKPGDGSVVTYSWYRFADQPAILNANMTDEEREAMQAKVETLHRSWSIDGEYLPPPAGGKLADLEPALIVTPPKGLEVGYVPIVTRQAAE